jgi:hypothetical protein
MERADTKNEEDGIRSKQSTISTPKVPGFAPEDS